MVKEQSPLLADKDSNGSYGDALRHDQHVSFEPSVPSPEDDEQVFEPLGRHGRSDSHGSVLEVALESLVDVKDVIVETVEEVVTEIQEVVNEEVIVEPLKPREKGDHDQRLGAVALAILVFYKVSGGPFGCEPAVKAAGPFVTLVSFLIFPMIWSLPEALVTAELGSAYPEPSGSIAWVEEAFGHKAGLLSGYFHWVSGATDNAIYPSLFLKYVASYIHQEDYLNQTLVRFLFTVAITAVLSFINYTGLEIVGNLSVLVCIVSMAPFVILCFESVPRLDPNRWLIMPTPGVTTDDDLGEGFFPDPVAAGILWRPLLNNLFWNLNSFDVGASFSGEVRDPERVFPKAMFLAVSFVVLSYVLPLAAALGAMDSQQEDWSAGYFTTVTEEVGGSWLAAWMVFAAAISNIALFEAEMSGDAYQLMGMGDRGMIPKLFTKRSRFNTPQNGIILGTLVIIAMSVADFESLVEMLNFAYSLSMLMEFGAFIKLRITDGDVERPYKIPLSTAGCVFMLMFPSLFLLYLMSIASKMTYIYFAMLTSFGFLFHVFQKIARHYNLLQYVEAVPKRQQRRSAPNSNPADHRHVA